MSDGEEIRFSYIEPISPQMEAALACWEAKAQADGYTTRLFVEHQYKIVTRLKPWPDPVPPFPSLPAPVVGELWVDVSRHNWPVDIQAFKAAGVRRVYARASIGAAGVDDRWQDIRNAVLAAGLGLGAYHYFVWNEDPARQADNFKRVTTDFFTEPPVVDAERRRNVPTDDPRIFLPEVVNKSVANVNLLALLHSLGGADLPVPGIYTSKAEWAAMFSLSAGDVAQWWKWIAHYRNGADRWPEPLHLAQPNVPAGWWARVHQYRVAEPGELTWHPRALDLNVYRGDTPVAPPPGPLFRVRVTAAGLNVRGGPGTTFPILGSVPNGAELDVYEVHAPSGWLRVHATDQRWVSGGATFTVRL
jgi:GH25 family lysozyme M1 (1,4-beta-N-acetylmuramidase)